MKLLTTLALALLSSGNATALPNIDVLANGRVITYRTQPGDTPAAVAAQLGVPPDELRDFLSAAGISDPTRVPAGFTYRLPHPAVAQLDAALANNGALLSTITALESDAATTTYALETARAEALRNADAVAIAARLTARNRLAVGALLGALLLAVAAVVATNKVVQQERVTAKQLQELMRDLENKRQAWLLERQQSARRILNLETELREALRPEVVVRMRG